MADLDIEEPAALITYLRRSGHIAPAETPQITLLAGGVSNRTVLVERASGEAWVLKQALTKLRVPVDWFSDPERVHREALGLHWLAQLTPPGVIPTLIFEDHTYHLLAMTAVPQPHSNWKGLLLAGQLQLTQVEQFATLLATIHSRAAERQAELAPLFADRTFFESLRLEPYYEYTATQVSQAAPFLRALVTATRQRSYTLVHGDYSPKNTLVYAGQLILLDFEVIHWGDPAFDLGFSLTHLLSKAHQLTAMRTEFAAAAQYYWQTYQRGLAENPPGLSAPWQQTLEPFVIRHTLACLLARVAGRSPLEYLSSTARRRQQAVVVRLMQAMPLRLENLINSFIDQIEAEEALAGNGG
ncbi:MAG: phosphotransferase [Caldilineaceae bacterium]|nr:phosphotransferase [Caldilineaceae bacterium]